MVPVGALCAPLESRGPAPRILCSQDPVQRALPRVTVRVLSSVAQALASQSGGAGRGAAGLVGLVGSAPRTPPLLGQQRGSGSAFFAACCGPRWAPGWNVWLAEVACLHQSRICGGRDGGPLDPHTLAVGRAERQPQAPVTTAAQGRCLGLGRLGAKLPSGLLVLGTGCRSLDIPPSLPGAPQLAGGLYSNPALPLWPGDGPGQSPFLLGKHMCNEASGDLNWQLLSQFFQNFACGREARPGGSSLSEAGLGTARALLLKFPPRGSRPLPASSPQLGQEHRGCFTFTVMKQGWRGIPGSTLPNTGAPPWCCLASSRARHRPPAGRGPCWQARPAPQYSGHTQFPEVTPSQPQPSPAERLRALQQPRDFRFSHVLTSGPSTQPAAPSSGLRGVVPLSCEWLASPTHGPPRSDGTPVLRARAGGQGSGLVRGRREGLRSARPAHSSGASRPPPGLPHTAGRRGAPARACACGPLLTTSPRQGADPDPQGPRSAPCLPEAPVLDTGRGLTLPRNLHPGGASRGLERLQWPCICGYPRSTRGRAAHNQGRRASPKQLGAAGPGAEHWGCTPPAGSREETGQESCCLGPRWASGSGSEEASVV